ncbi:capsule assembly Wzi family protein [Olivibacter ginsenosidimutans]|uniref:Capsule assembly Wzi family protein n=1 Tax=Olivibacter ginsenosidimutans TaxID=1176537 RepID=A0ABP9ABU5_9SPHI
MIVRNIFVTGVFLVLTHSSFAQDSLYQVKLEAQAGVTSTQHVPFWLRSNQFGSVPLDGASGSFIVNGTKRYTSDYQQGGKLFDWGAGFEGRVNGGNRGQFLLLEAYGKVRLAMFELKVGRSKDVMGLNGDTTLSSGNFAVSGNALGIPKVQLSIPNYYTLPIFDGLLAIKGNIAHGWVGRMPFLKSQFADPNNPYIEDGVPTYFHQTSLYGRIGKADWRAKVYLGINHEAYWGNEKAIYGKNFGLSPIESFYYVAIGKVYKFGGGTGYTKIGNQLGSVDIGFQYDFDQVSLLAYRQNIYDVGALAKLANIRDGLNGIALTNRMYRTDPNQGFQWKKLLFEFLYTKNQAGEKWSKPTASGDEDYYNNAYYTEGWSYQDIGLGTPFITPRHFAKDGQVSTGQYFINNRVIALHGGAEFSYQSWWFLGKMSYSKNYGTFATSKTGSSTGSGFNSPVNGIFKSVNQFSTYLEINKHLKNGFSAGGAIAIDRGELLDNSVGGFLKITKEFCY